MKFSTVNRSKSTYCQSVLNATFSSVFVDSSFTGKEKDSESDYHYFGARYYDSEALTGWLSVDPMADKFGTNGEVSVGVDVAIIFGINAQIISRYAK